MFTAFSTALSALTADSTAVAVVGNNLANLNTTGFKASTVSFHDLVNDAMKSTQVQPGFGVSSPTITNVYSQGPIQSSNGPYDAAIQGNGFFVVTDANNNQLLTRSGNFTVDSSGNLLTSSGEHVQGWSSNTGSVNTGGAIGNIVIPSGFLNPPVATANISTQVNLDASQTVGATAATCSTPIPVYDSLGVKHVVTLTFTKTATNTWGYSATLPGTDLTGGAASTPSVVASGTLTFDSSGNLLSPAATSPTVALSASGLADGAANLSMNWNLWNTSGATPTSTITQVAQAFSATSPIQDGSAAAQVSSVSIGAHGEITATYSEGQPRVVAQLALADVKNPETLVSAGNGNLEVGATTSLPSIGVPNTGGLGDIVGGALESSTVDIAREFTNLIVYQRSYEANAKVVSTADTLSQDTINLIPQ